MKQKNRVQKEIHFGKGGRDELSGRVKFQLTSKEKASNVEKGGWEWKF